MMQIGEFSILSQITINMLRHYDEIGLLHPIHTDKFTGYRYYSKDQLPTANKILALKRMGFSLPTIREIVTKHAGSEELKQYLEAQAEETRGRIAAMQRQLNLVEKAIENFNHPSNIPTHNVTMKHFAERMVISYRNRIALPDQEGFLWEKLDEGVKSHHVQLAVPRLDLAIFHDESFIEQNLDVEVQRSVTGKYQDTDCIKFKSVAAFSAATLIYKGHYTKLPEAYEAIARWISDNHYQMFGPHFNIYHRSPETESSYENMVTEVCFPIKSI